MRMFRYVSTTAHFYFLTVQQAIAAGTGGGLNEIGEPVKKLADTMTGPLATDLTAVAGVVGAFMWSRSDHGPGTQRAGAWIAGGALACNVRPIMNTLGFAGAVF